MEEKVGWIEIELGQLCDVVRGASPRPMGDPRYFTGAIPFIKIGDITKISGKTIFDSEIYVNEEGAKKSRLLKKGSLILSNSGTVCLPKFLGVDSCIHDGFVTFNNIPDFVSLNFLFHYFHYIRPYVIQKHKQGVTQVNLNTTIVKEFKISLPSLPEQRSIVSKIELLFSELDNGISNLKRAQEQLKVYRQAVLKKAFEGSVKVPFSDLVKSSQNGISKRSGKEGVELKVLRLADISNLEINYSSPRCIKLTSSEINKYKLLKDDLICIRVNGSKNLVGRLIITSEKDDLNNWAFCDHFIRFSLDLSNAVPKYYYYYFHIKEVRQYIDENMVSSAGQNTVSEGTVKSVLVPFSSHSEQQAIVQEIETRLSVCDKIEQDIKDNLEKAEALRQSILKKAFEGKLLNERELAEVRGAEDWEPAEVLLERIKAEKAQNGKKIHRYCKGYCK